MTRDIASSFNAKYGEVFVLPEARIDEQLMTIPGTDGQKMSKSYGNIIDIFLPEKQLKKQVMSIITDSKALEEPKDPEVCNVFNLYRLLADAADTQVMRENYLQGGYGYGHAKKALLELMIDKYASERATFAALMDDQATLETELRRGEDKARIIATRVIDRVRKTLGFA
jgi:tryptophanyl-tRNA synthetase